MLAQFEADEIIDQYPEKREVKKPIRIYVLTQINRVCKSICTPCFMDSFTPF